MQDLALLGVFAHPDDEQLMSGVFASAAAEGMRTGLVCATRGELGEIADPSLATPENLGEVREHELKAACAVLGVKYLWFLDYRDSGMMGTGGNTDPSSLYKSNEDEAVGKIVKIVRDFRPTVMVTFDETGGYGHPDHLTIHRLATVAFHVAGDTAKYPEAGEPWQPARLYYAGFPRSYTRRIGEMAAMAGVQVQSWMEQLDPDQFGIDDALITNRVDVREWLPLKEKSLRQHRTQMNPENLFSKLPGKWIDEMRATEHYALAAGVPLPESDGAEADLFAGLR
jgi:mycothiol S-conjugate amidase